MAGSHENKPPLRIISMAWGESYVDEFLELCLPALLAPGNLPALNEHFTVSLVFVTETRLFSRVRGSPGIKSAEQICKVKLSSLNDLAAATADAYGMAITYALYRGFEDLGDAMTDCYLLFLNSDFILAENSYRGLLPYLLRGERLILAPSYCVNSEEVLPEVLAARTNEGSVSLSTRRMADIILRHRHLSIRTKTFNQCVYSANIIDQIYYAVDEKTLLGMQLPVAVVAMKPERVPEGIHSLWDYGLIAEFCPSLEFCVLSDSDKFLMMELRERDRGRDEVRLGWPTPEKIAHGLKHVATTYTVAAGQEILVLHSDDLCQEAVENGSKVLRALYGEIVDCLRPLASHKNHIQWVTHFERFHLARSEYLKNSQGFGDQFEGRDAETLTSTTAYGESNQFNCHNDPSRDCLTRSLVAAILEGVDPRTSVTEFPIGQGALTRVIELRQELREKLSSLECDLEIPNVTPEAMQALIRKSGHLITQFGHACDAVELAVMRIQSLEIAGYQKRLQKCHRNLDAFCGAIAAPAPPALPRSNTGLSRKVWNAVFGAAPNYRPWHWLHAPTWPLRIVHRSAKLSAKTILNIKGADAVNFLAPDCGTKIVTVRLTDLHDGKLRFQETFDACFIECNCSELRHFREVFERVRPLLRPGGSLVAFFLNTGASGNLFPTDSFDDSFLPISGPMQTYVASGLLSFSTIRLRRNIVRMLTASGILSQSKAMRFAMILTAPMALLGSLADRRNGERTGICPERVTSITFQFQIG